MPLVIRNYQASFDLFLKDLQEVLEFIEPVEANKTTFSHRTYGLLLRVCTDFESLAKDLSIDAGDTTPPDKKELEGQVFNLDVSKISKSKT